MRPLQELKSEAENIRNEPTSFLPMERGRIFLLYVGEILWR
jgi:hypothetical protein